MKASDINPNQNSIIESLIKTALVFLIIYVCFLILRPFLLVTIWGIIIAVAFYPLHLKLTRWMKSNSTLSAITITVVSLALLIVPSAIFAEVLIDSVQNLATHLEEGTFHIPPPEESIKDWPLIGELFYEIWSGFYENLTAGLQKYSEQLKTLGEWLFTSITSVVTSILIFVGSIILSGVFLKYSNHAYQTMKSVFEKLIGAQGEIMVINAKDTIRSVVYGVIGTAAIQAAIIGIGFFFAGVPGAPIFTILVLLLAITQLPIIIIVLPVVIYMFPQLSGWGATLFVIWCVIGALSDSFIKPLLMGRGVQIPMLVILIGSLGGMILIGIIGLFIGAVVLALGYQIFKMWIGIDSTSEADKSTVD